MYIHIMEYYKSVYVGSNRDKSQKYIIDLKKKLSEKQSLIPVTLRLKYASNIISTSKLRIKNILKF